jgi:hypothetical protein
MEIGDVWRVKLNPMHTSSCRALKVRHQRQQPISTIGSGQMHEHHANGPSNKNNEFESTTSYSQVYN